MASKLYSVLAISISFKMGYFALALHS